VAKRPSHPPSTYDPSMPSIANTPSVAGTSALPAAAKVTSRSLKVAVLGAGSWGTTVASLTASRNQVILYARDSSVVDDVNSNGANTKYLKGYSLAPALRATTDLAAAVGDADVVIVGIPSHNFRNVLEQCAPHIRPWIPIVSLTKGFERGTVMRMTEVIKDVLPGHPAAALTGPNLAKEVMAGYAAGAVIATEDLSVARALQSVFHRSFFRTYTNHDVLGCEVAGALKNVIAIAAGMAEGLSVGDNTRAAVVSRGLAELARLGTAMGGQATTFSGLAGLGDLMATCMSPQSRNRYVGEQLGRGKKLPEILSEMNMVAEGVKTAETVMVLSERHGIAMPICKTVYRVLEGEIDAAAAYAGLLQVRPGHEDDPD
jgi:glycerol-3-phosphate dehydrogenase (NAD(P)+)